MNKILESRFFFDFKKKKKIFFLIFWFCYFVATAAIKMHLIFPSAAKLRWILIECDGKAQFGSVTFHHLFIVG